MAEHIGFIGVGTMGAALAGRLLDAGYRLTIFDTSKKAVTDCIKRGAKAATSPGHVASDAELVFVCLPRPGDVHEVALGKNGIANGNKARVYVDFSTTGPTMAARSGRDSPNTALPRSMPPWAARCAKPRRAR